MGGRATSDRGDSSRSPVVADSSTIIALERIDRLDLLHSVYNEVVLPPAVMRELGPASYKAWMAQRAPSRPFDPSVEKARLDPGEREVIALGIELSAHRVILDDLPARRVAHMLGLSVIGTVGVLVVAKQLALLPEIRPNLEALMRAGFYIGHDLYHQALIEADEPV